MARIFVTSDDRCVRVEIDYNMIEDEYSAVCDSCGRDVVAGERDRAILAEVTSMAGIHADQHGDAS